MCIYTLQKQQVKKKFLRVVRNSTERLKISVNHTAKTNKDLGMSCYIRVDNSVFFRW